MHEKISQPMTLKTVSGYTKTIWKVLNSNVRSNTVECAWISKKWTQQHCQQ